MILNSPNGKNIVSVEDWFCYAPPLKGEDQWKDGRSAKELAKAWFRNGTAQIPHEMFTLLESHPITRGAVVEYGMIEKETTLDDFRGSGRKHDLVLSGTNAAKGLLIAIEAKTDEPFGKRIGDYRTSSVKANRRSRVPDRIRQLAEAIFSHTEVEHLRYQLLHAVAGTLIEAQLQKAAHAVLIIHEFVPPTGKTKKAEQNERDLQAFVGELLQRRKLEKGKLVGPIHVPGGGRISPHISLYLGKIETNL